MNDNSKKVILRIGILTLLFLLVTSINNYFNFGEELAIKYFSIFIYIGFIFLLILFLIFRKKFTEIKVPKFDLKQATIFFLVALALLLVRFLFVPAPFRKGFTIVAFILIALGLFGLNYSTEFARKFKYEIAGVAILFIGLNYLTFLFEDAWQLFSNTSTIIVYHLLNLSFENVMLDLSTPGKPIVGPQGFIAGVYKQCSGIESLIIFTTLFALAVAMEFDKLKKSRVVIGFIIGILGMYLITVLRIYVIIVVGALIGAEFAVNLVHNAISMVLFVAYFILFWFFSFKWMKKKSPKIDKK